MIQKCSVLTASLGSRGAGKKRLFFEYRVSVCQMKKFWRSVSESVTILSTISVYP